MPTYEYCCRACSHEFEQFQSILASPVKTCPRCGKRKVERKLSTGGGILFKGGGFYETDYRSDAYKKAADADSKAAEPAKTEGKSDAKTDAKSETKPTGPSKPPVKDSVKEPVKEPAAAPIPAARSKNHAREGRGVGNIVQAGRTKSKPPGSAKRRSR